MSFPNVPLGKTDWDRKLAQAVNHLLNQVTYYTISAEGIPDAGQELWDEEFPVSVRIDSSSCALRLKDETGIAPTSDATFTLTVGGVTFATGTIPAGQSEGNWAFTSTAIPDFTRTLITAPSPQDATLSDVIISLAVSE